MEEKKWYAVYTNNRCEKKVSELLTRKGIENYCPLTKIQKQWSDRKKTILEPLFTSYVFVRIIDREQSSVWKTQGIINFVYWLKKPAVIREAEIETIKNFLKSYTNVFIEKTEVNLNDTVKILTGPFMEQKGNVLSVKNNKVKIMLPTLGYWMHAEVETTNIKVIQESLIPRNKLMTKLNN
jgi:transcription antitermination factor NusG